METEVIATGLSPSKKNKGKVPRRVNKAEREKMKREHLNDLFLSLAEALELNEQNSGKASTLCETTRFVKDMFDQIETLKKDNAALLSEAQYVAIEKNELQDENSALQAQIESLKSMLEERAGERGLDLNTDPAQQLPVNDPSVLLNPVFIVPAFSSFHTPELDSTTLANKPISNISKPHPRYPTPSDSWPFQILDKLSGGEELQHKQSQV